ncbi:MAG TPA: MBL fold metallo-hydrolase [Vicinamibacterales bacterium]|nr:MBL fold metallo-hydrolase [Vicinamibacterales bacterium]
MPVPAAYSGALPPASPPDGMSIAVINTGYMEWPAGLAFRGGSFRDCRHFPIAAILVRHPRGDLLIDAGLGANVAAHLATQPKLAQLTTTPSKPVRTQLSERGYSLDNLKGVLITHAHWDHVSGIEDLPDVPVWINGDERKFVHSRSEHAALLHGFSDVQYHKYSFEQQSYLGFDNSHDVWGDGSIVIVPAPGHTPGSVIVFLTLPGDQRYALLGDLVWQRAGITRPAERPWPIRRLIDENADQVRNGIRAVRAIHERYPTIKLVPAHDAQALAELPAL